MQIYGPCKGSYIVSEAGIDRITAEFENEFRIPHPPVIHLTMRSFPPGLRAKTKRLYTQTAKFNYRIGSSGTIGGVRTLGITLLRADLQGEDPADIIQATIRDIAYQHTVIDRFAPIALQNLKLNCSALSLGPTGVRGFQGLTSVAHPIYGSVGRFDFPGLHTVSLELSHNDIKDEGCVKLWNAINDGVTEDQPRNGPIGGSQLTTLYLGLKKNSIGSLGALYLAKFKRLQKIVNLYIDLEDNAIEDFGAYWLTADEPDDPSKDGRFAGPNLSKLVLNCKNNGITDDGVSAFTSGTYGRWHRPPGGYGDIQSHGCLDDLSLNLDGNQITFSGLLEIAQWKYAVRTAAVVGPEYLHVHIVGNPGTSKLIEARMKIRS
jgi:hypothetical protein